MTYPFVQAKHYHKGDNDHPTRIVIHRMEAPEKGDTAETCAHYFATTDRVASAHLCIDNNSVVQCVDFHDVAYHAPPNYHSIGVEHAGIGEDWAAGGAYDSDMLKLSAMAVATLCKDYNIPVVWLSPADLVAGRHGVTSHYNVSQAFHKSTHTDGQNFPYQQYLNMVNFFLSPQPVYVKEPELMIDVVDALPSPNGGVWILQKDGGVFTYHDAPYYGSYPGLNIDAGNKRTFGNIKALSNGGYQLVATSGETYEFDPA